MYLANETEHDVFVSRTKHYKIRRNSMVSVDRLAGALGTDHKDIENAVPVQYPDLKLINARLVVDCDKSVGLPGDELEVDDLC